MKSPSGGQPIFTVSELNRHARLLLEERFNLVWVRGEMSNFRRPGSGHWYFTLKDEQGQIGCAMFINRNRQARMQPRDGVEVIIRGRVSLYEARGNYQIIVDAIEPAGEGALRIAFEALKDKLAAEGMFAAERKRALPALPSRLAIISSASGAALRDVLAVVRRRYPALAVTLLPVAVQGDEAERQILRALERAPATSADLVLLTRGGGSLEDLWAFNLESVARAVAACPLPTVVAIGHETDFAIAEFTADLRAGTPSAAAELITPDSTELGAALLGRLAQLHQSMRHQLAVSRHRLGASHARLRDPRERLRQLMQRADDIERRLTHALGAMSERTRLQVERLTDMLHARHPRHALAVYGRELPALATRLNSSMQTHLARNRRQADALFRTLRAVSPRMLLERGYGIVEDAAGGAVTSTINITVGEKLRVSLSDGALGVAVEEIAPLGSILGATPGEPDGEHD